MVANGMAKGESMSKNGRLEVDAGILRAYEELGESDKFIINVDIAH